MASITFDGRTVIGADTDGSLTMRTAGRGRMELCYVNAAAGPSQSMVASCGTMQRAR